MIQGPPSAAASSEGLLACLEALPTGSKALPAGYEALLAGSEVLTHYQIQCNEKIPLCGGKIGHRSLRPLPPYCQTNCITYIKETNLTAGHIFHHSPLSLRCCPFTISRIPTDSCCATVYSFTSIYNNEPDSWATNPIMVLFTAAIRS